jgi:hypothetical protein
MADDGHGEAVAAVSTTRSNTLELRGRPEPASVRGWRCRGCGGVGAGRLVGALEAGEPGDRVDGGLLQHEGVTGSEGLHLREGQGLVADAVDVASGRSPR